MDSIAKVDVGFIYQYVTCVHVLAGPSASDLGVRLEACSTKAAVNFQSGTIQQGQGQTSNVQIRNLGNRNLLCCGALCYGREGPALGHCAILNTCCACIILLSSACKMIISSTHNNLHRTDFNDPSCSVKENTAKTIRPTLMKRDAHILNAEVADIMFVKRDHCTALWAVQHPSMTPSSLLGLLGE